MNKVKATYTLNNAPSSNTKAKGPQTKDPPKYEIDEEEDVPEDDNEEESQGSKSKKFKDNNLGNIKLKIPEFKGDSNTKLYLEWEDKVEKNFDIHDYSEKKKVTLAVVEFLGYASIWWRKLYRSREDNGTRPIATWVALKKVM